MEIFTKGNKKNGDFYTSETNEPIWDQTQRIQQKSEVTTSQAVGQGYGRS